MPLKNAEVSKPQPDAPQLSTSPLESLSPNRIYQKSVLGQYGYPALAGVGGMAIVGITNFASKRPVLARLPLYSLFGAVATAALYYFQEYRENQWAERDAIFRHYISLHPEDFPPYNRVKFGELFQEWTPIR